MCWIEPAMHRVDPLAEAVWRDGNSDPNGKVVFCQILLRS
jgi:hypothetical protein